MYSTYIISVLTFKLFSVDKFGRLLIFCSLLKRSEVKRSGAGGRSDPFIYKVIVIHLYSINQVLTVYVLC